MEPLELSYVKVLEIWDIPPGNLKVLDQKLGGGQFGIVKKGLLAGKDGDFEVVAVKMVKGTVSYTNYRPSLFSSCPFTN